MTPNISWHMKNKIEIRKRNDPRFAVLIGKRSPDVVLPAMPIRISYFGLERDYSLETKQGKHFFRIRIPKILTPGWDLDGPWDAYHLRDSFERLKSPKQAWRWLNVVGKFRDRRTISKDKGVLTWCELQGWQEIFRRLRSRDSSKWFPMLGVQDDNDKSMFERSEFIAELGDLAEQIWNVSEETFGWLQGIPQGLSIRRDMYVPREEIEEIFSSPGARTRGSQQWHYAQSVLGRRREKRARGNAEGKQKLIAEVTPQTAFDAILATVYADKLRGIEFQVCALKDCNETFEKLSEHGKIYCSNYHAHLASIRRKRAKARESSGKTLNKTTKKGREQ